MTSDVRILKPHMPVFIETDLRCYIGRVKAINESLVILENACWIKTWRADLQALLNTGNIGEVCLFSYPLELNIANIQMATAYPHTLPRTEKARTEIFPPDQEG